MSKKKIIITFLIILIIIIIGVGAFYAKNILTKQNKKNYQIEKIDKYNYFILKREEKYGVIDDKGNIIINTQFDNIKIPNPSKDVFVCYIENESQILNSNNEKILTQYNQVEPIKLNNVASDLIYEKSVLTYKENDKYGIIDFMGNKITEPIYESIESLTYREGELLTKKDNKYGIININGYIVIDNMYDGISSDVVISENEKETLGYIVENKTDDGVKCGYIDHSGKIRLELEYNEILRINDNDEIYLVVRKNGQYGILKNYEKVLDFAYQDIEYNSENKIFIVQKGTKYGIVNLDGNIVLPLDYSKLEVKGMYIYAEKENEKGVYNVNGEKENIDFNTTITETSNDKYNIKIKNENNRNIYGVIDENGNSIIPDEYLYLEYVYNDYFIACGENGKLGVIDINNNIIVDMKHDLVQKINDKEIIQTLDVDSKTTTIYSSNMKKSLEMKNANIDIKDDYIKVYSNTELNYLDNNGNVIENNNIFNHNLYASSQDGKWGFKDKSGEFIINPEYERVTDFNEYGYASIKKDNKWGSINENGEIIVEPKYEFDSEYVEVEFINKYYKNQYGFGEIYYTDDIKK